MTRTSWIDVFAALVSAVTLSPAMAAEGTGPASPAEITVTSRVIAHDVEPLGANLTTIAGGTNFAINNHVWNSGFEPIVWRKMTRVERAGPDWFAWDAQGGPGCWNLAWTGLGNGATVRFYRIVDERGQPLGFGGGRDWNDLAGADHVVLVGEAAVPLPSAQFPEGGYLANDDRDGDKANDVHRVHIDRADLELRFGDYAYLKLKTDFVGPETSPPDLRQHYAGDRPFFHGPAGAWTGRIVPHPQPVPAEFRDRGETCLRVEIANLGSTALEQYVYHPLDAGEGQWYSQLHPGASYRVEVWLRQEGLQDGGRARFVLRRNEQYAAASQREPWTVTGSWRKYTYDFIAPPYPTSPAGHISHGLEFTGPGTVWLDNFVLYRHDAEHEFRPFTPHTISFQELMAAMPAAGRKPALRFYGTIFHPSSIEAMFTDYGNSRWEVAWNSRVGDAPATTIAQCMYWASRTGDSPFTRVVPYLTCNEEYTEDEWMALIEYLGVPYDPAVDTPERKPHAYTRYVYRGENGTPWTDEFREIVVEYGNETWHNGAGGYGWDGWGPPGWVHFGGREYGLFARYMFQQHVMRMPAWREHRLGDKIKFALGGNYTADLESDTAYGERAVQGAGGAVSCVGHANYVGPKWETGDQGSTSFNDHGVQETLVARVTGIGGVIDAAVRARETLDQRGIHYQLTAYEGGPSGYWQNKDNPQVDELYGKSLAMGLSALDAWMYSSLRGFRHQCYLGFSSGKWWSSHTLPEAGGFRPHAGWLALQMRNRHMVGDQMLEVRVDQAPTYGRQGVEIPLVTAYALRGDRVWSVLVLNRKCDGVHDGTDFGDGTTPVSLHLPFESVRRVTLHTLARPDGSPADPRDNNLAEQRVAIVSRAIDAGRFSRPFVIDHRTGGLPGGLPPAGVYLYVFEQ
ncbi:hypothetical protein FJY94_04955 [Candidatus Kaiserbacteria bacterium]|nr:hypothetical protein [Candidatus Kaiserbacteria bacterium]